MIAALTYWKVSFIGKVNYDIADLLAARHVLVSFSDTLQGINPVDQWPEGASLKHADHMINAGLDVRG